MQFCRGIVRKLSIPVVVLSLLGWILYVIGFAAFNHTDNYYTNNQSAMALAASGRAYFAQVDGSLPPLRADLLWFPHWCMLIVGPFVFICTALHLIVARAFTGIFTKFLTAVYLGAGGAVVYTTGVLLFSDTRSGLEYVLQLQDRDGWLTERERGLWHVLEFAGSLFSIFFMTLFMMMWPLFSERYVEEYYEEEEEEEDKEAV